MHRGFIQTSDFSRRIAHAGVPLLMLLTLLFGWSVLVTPSPASAQMRASQRVQIAKKGVTQTPYMPVPAKVIAQYAKGEFLESVAFDCRDNLYVTLSIAGQIRRIAPDGTQTIIATFPVGKGGFGKQPGVLGSLAIAVDGTVYATFTSTDPSKMGIWRVTPGRTPQRLASLPENAQPNDIVLDQRGNIFVADSALGVIWRVSSGSHTAAVWLANPLLAPKPGSRFPGANGLAFFSGALYVSNSSTGTIVSVPVSSQGVAGKPSVYASGIPTDDFAFDVHGNLYVTTHPLNTVVRIKPNGSREILASLPQHIIGPSAAAFGTRGRDTTNLYVVTDGGLFGSLLDPKAPTGPPSVVRLKIGLVGYPVR